jgi:hypothetical protein
MAKVNKKLVNGSVVDMTADEISIQNAEEQAWADGQADRDLADLRTERNILLAQTDFYGNSDVTMSEAMTTYRQALRDITNSATSLDDVTWPEKP